jgi:hypothetical protein
MRTAYDLRLLFGLFVNMRDIFEWRLEVLSEFWLSETEDDFQTHDEFFVSYLEPKVKNTKQNHFISKVA